MTPYINEEDRFLFNQMIKFNEPNFSVVKTPLKDKIIVGIFWAIPAGLWLYFISWAIVRVV